MKVVRFQRWSILRSWRIAGIIWACIAGAAIAHPLGNDSITHFSVLYVLPDRFEVDLVLDIAETQSVIIRREEIDADGDDVDTPEEQRAWLDRKAVEFEERLRATLNGERLQLRAVDEAFDPKTGRKAASSRIIVKMPGYIGLPTYRLLIRYVAEFPEPLAPGQHTISYEDRTFPNILGMSRIILDRTPGVEFESPRPAFWDEGVDPFIYEQYDPANLPIERSATLTFRVLPPVVEAEPSEPVAPRETEPELPGEEAIAEPTAVPATQPADDAPPPEAGQDADEPTMPAIFESLLDPRNDPSMTDRYFRQADHVIGLLQQSWGLVMFLTVTVLSFTWGAGHALMPGHAKTVVAAYLISQRGTYWHAVLLAIIVTVTHTALVVILGLVIWMYQASNPGLGAALQNWLGVTAGLLVAGMGGVLAWRALTGRLGHHHHDHDHHHHGHEDDRPWWRRLFTHSHPHVPGHVHGHDHHGPGDHGHDHTHDHGHGHHHHDHEGHHHHHHHDHHDGAHGHAHKAHGASAVSHAPSPRGESAAPLSTWTLLVLGISGGIVPCPTATIIMLLGIGANVVLGALYAVGVFSLGLALTLMLVGFLALSSRRFAARILSDAREEHGEELSGRGRWLLLRVVPTVSGTLVVILGLAIAVNYLYFMQVGRSLIPWLG